MCRDCDVMNVHVRDEPADTHGARCGLCCYYCVPVGVAVMIILLILAYIVFFIFVMKDFPDAWHIIVSIIFILLIIVVGPVVLWSLYMPIVTAPGFVERDPWMYRPHYRAPSSSSGGGGPSRAAQVSSPVSHSGSYSARIAAADNRATGSGEDRNPLLGQPPAGDSSEKSSSAPVDPEGIVSPMEAALYPTEAREETEVQVAVGDDREPRRRTHSPYDTSNPNANANGVGGGGTAATTTIGAVDGGDATSPTTTGDGDPRNPYVVTQLDRWGRLRYCKKCKVFKPDNSFHGPMTDRCVYDLDHGCGILKSDIARNNYKLFVLFLLYSSTACIFFGALMTIGIFAMYDKPMMDKLGWIAVPGIMLVLGFALFVFYIEHRCCLLPGGKTTMNSVIKERAAEERRRQRGFNPWSNARRQYDAAHPEEERRRLTQEEKLGEAAREKERIAEHRRNYMGDETGLRAYLIVPVRTDNTAEGLPRV